MKSLMRCVTPVFLLAALLACTLVAPLPLTAAPGGAVTPPAPTVIASTVPTNKPPVLPGRSLPTLPLGLTAVNNFDSPKQGSGFFNGSLFDDQTYANPNIAGLTFRTSWEDIEPTEGNFVWTKLDTVFDKAKKNGKWVELVLIPGFATPAWALQGVQTASFSVIYGPGKGENMALPLPWDQTYLDRWFAFLKAVSARYQARPEFLKIAADGPTSVTAETSLPNAPADLCTWIQVGYTSDKLIGAWKQVFDQYAQIFPRQYFSVALYPPPPLVSTSRCTNGNPRGIDHNESQRVTAAIAEAGVASYPAHFVLQENGLTAAKESTPLGTYDVVKSYGGKIVIGYQLTTSAMNHPADMGDPDGATALQESLQRGVDAKAQFLEVWEPDALSPAAQNVLAATASALASVAQPALSIAAATPVATPAAAASPTATEGVRTARGVFIVTGHNVAIKPDTYANPAVDGIMIRTFWSNVEPASGQFDWSFIDSQVQAASASGKKVILTVLPGAFTPAWALQGVQSAQFVVD